jgi:MoaA/NifB/PqqE/SkfB family radical SAM enzyme
MNSISDRAFTLPVVILYVTEGCNLQCISCSYRERLPDELTLEEISDLARTLRAFGLRRIVYSGGEPLMRRDFPEICATFGRQNVTQSLLTNGFLLEKRFPEIRNHLSEIIVSVDGPDATTHNGIRGIDSFDRIVNGIKHVRSHSARPSIAIRTVVQRSNFNRMTELVRFAKQVGADRISFLAADVLSDSFGRATRGEVVPAGELQLTTDETLAFRESVNRMVQECRVEFATGFISDSPERMFHIVQYFEALAGGGMFPRNLCNAPMVSAVITSTGDLHPCYFLPSYGNVRSGEAAALLNDGAIRSTRRDVRRYKPERCKTCVCTLHKGPLTALRDVF